MSIRKGIISAILSLLATAASARGIAMDIPMVHKGANTFYVSGMIPGTTPAAFMVDTGSSYMTINEDTLEALRATDRVEYRRDIIGVLANGEEQRVAIYWIPKMLLGERCLLTDVEVAVFPGKTRQILGLNVLRRTSPFQFSVDPPSLRLSNCGQQLTQWESAK
jgi:predicted aspartyl protease